jgi:uncharacterized protein (TIGR03435 family)
MMTRFVVVFCVASVAAQANQAGPGEVTRFEVASIRPFGPPGGVGPVFGTLGFPPGRQFVASNVAFVALVRAAYPEFLSPHRIVGGPDWIRTQLFEINAKATGNPSRARLSEMLRALLADRFQLKVHTEQREIDAYALTRARSDGRLGSGLRRRTIDCEAPRPSPVPRPSSARRVPPRFEPLEPPECQWSSTAVNGVNYFAGRGELLSRLVAHLQVNVDRAIVDRTGLTGRFDFDLEHALLEGPSTTEQPGGAPPILTAIREQLGLRLESRKERMAVLVVDHVEMPSPN